jgi:hypothetical protein
MSLLFCGEGEGEMKRSKRSFSAEKGRLSLGGVMLFMLFVDGDEVVNL